MRGDIAVGVLALLGIGALVLILPVFYFLMGAFTGWILSNVLVFAGNWVVAGLALLRLEVTLAQLPLLCGTLGFIGAYFVKSSSVSKK